MAKLKLKQHSTTTKKESGQYEPNAIKTSLYGAAVERPSASDPASDQQALSNDVKSPLNRKIKFTKRRNIFGQDLRKKGYYYFLSIFYYYCIGSNGLSYNKKYIFLFKLKIMEYSHCKSGQNLIVMITFNWLNEHFYAF